MNYKDNIYIYIVVQKPTRKINASKLNFQEIEIKDMQAIQVKVSNFMNFMRMKDQIKIL